MSDVARYLPPDAVRIALVVGLSFLIGLEREEHKARSSSSPFGGVRTFPLVGLLGYGLAVLSGPQRIAVSTGLAIVGGFMFLSYRNKLTTGGTGVTSELSALVTYLIGALVQDDRIWMATALTVGTLLLLELKQALENLATRISTDDIVSVAKFLLLAVVILPIVPNRSFTRFAINPFRSWLVVVAVSGISYGGYLLQRMAHRRSGTLLSAILGGAYSSTLTTIALARQATAANRPRLYAGSILTASGVMYLRLALLMAFFSESLARRLAPSFVAIGVATILVGWLWSLRSDRPHDSSTVAVAARNPLELRAAFIFAAVFLVTMVVTQLVLGHSGGVGLYGVAALTGIVDVDPFILGVAQAPAPIHVAAVSIIVAAASNNVAKGVYALSFADRPTGLRALLALCALATIGLVPWLWL